MIHVLFDNHYNTNNTNNRKTRIYLQSLPVQKNSQIYLCANTIYTNTIYNEQYIQEQCICLPMIIIRINKQLWTVNIFEQGCIKLQLWKQFKQRFCLRYFFLKKKRNKHSSRSCCNATTPIVIKVIQSFDKLSLRTCVCIALGIYVFFIRFLSGLKYRVKV